MDKLIGVDAIWSADSIAEVSKDREVEYDFTEKGIKVKKISCDFHKKYGTGYPRNELGVILLFGACARDLGFSVVQIRSLFPDAKAYSTTLSQNINIEFEYLSSNFIVHQHDVKNVDLIVCWIHDCYVISAPVLELRSALIYFLQDENTIKVFDWLKEKEKIKVEFRRG